MKNSLTLQLHDGGEWQDAAVVEFRDPGAGHRGATMLILESDHCFDRLCADADDINAMPSLGVRFPAEIEFQRFDTWPPFLLDMLPQGYGRQALVDALVLPDGSASSEYPLLRRSAGAPIGNIRVKEAWQAERNRIEAANRLKDWDHEELLSSAATAPLALSSIASHVSGALGIQGAWPKAMLTRSSDGLWYPDAMVSDADATEHVIVKWNFHTGSAAGSILAAEAPYLELARAFGLRCGRPLVHRDGALVMPRFDRRIEEGRIIRLGQESMASAAGIAAFGQDASHETYLDVIRKHSSNPATDITEYVLRDLLNLAMGNPDNHGRNAALQKDVDGTIRLTPLFDFCPMRMASEGIRRSTTWACMRKDDAGSRDLDPDWEVVCEVAADGMMDAGDLRRTVAAKADLLAGLPRMALDLGVHQDVVRRAMGRCEELARSIARLTPGRCPSSLSLKPR